MKITYSKKQSHNNYVHMSRNLTYSFLCKVDDANGISSLQSLVQVRSILRSKQAIFTRNIQLTEAFWEKQSLKENLKTKTTGHFFVPHMQTGYFFSYNTHDEEKKYLPCFIFFMHLLLK